MPLDVSLRMNRRQIGSVLAGIAAVGFLATAALHATGYGFVTQLAEQAPAELRPLIPALWLVFSIDLIVLGLIVAVVARRPTAGGWLILVIAAICPLAAAGLQIRFLGFVGPTAILLGVGVVTLIAAVTIRLPSGDPAAPAA